MPKGDDVDNEIECIESRLLQEHLIRSNCSNGDGPWTMAGFKQDRCRGALLVGVRSRSQRCGW